ncbi:MAG: CRISPR-associated endonuclease Cas2 [Candidatus Competibacteraceae bacterium]|nr:CRISPR-associated endonuclease Cas2 [Candidatus Competibacteraceae bacterium]
MRRLWAISYDIVEDKRRRQVATTLEDHGARVQGSVFECYLDKTTLTTLRARLVDMIDPATDSIRWYPLCTWCRQRVVWKGPVGGTDDPPYFVV